MAQWCGLLALVALVAVARSSPTARFAVPPAEPLQDGVEAPLGVPVGVPVNPTPPRPWHATKPQAVRVAAADVDQYRLPTNVVPTRYQLLITVDMANLAFEGGVGIRLNALEETDTVVLHAGTNLEFQASDVLMGVYPNGPFLELGSMRRTAHETVTFKFKTPLLKDVHYTLAISAFKSPLGDDLKGFYASSYTTGTETRYLALTQFESTSARRAFPCFDEPSFKARFELRIGHDPAYVVRSNMRESGQDKGTDSTVITIFEPTLPMSTYLLAWVVSDFEHKSNEDETFNTWARKDIIAGANISQDVGPKALEEMHKFTGIAYALPKTDQFAIPDFNAGAMENWGLVTFKEKLLIQTESTDVKYEQEIATVICHELSHQWTGNLVTMDWWSHTWLNEGFATFFENFICDKLKPEMRLMEKAITSYAAVAMSNDLLPSQHAMSSDVSSPAEIESKFDRISYAKGGTVLRMFQQVLTPAVFQKGIARYLSINAYKTGTPERLFRAFDAEVAIANAKTAGTVLLPENVDFATVAKTWTEQPGVPVVTATCDFKAKKCTLKQEQLRMADLAQDASNKWYIPVTVASSKAPVASDLRTAAWLLPDNNGVTIDIDVGGDADDWVVINPQQTGYYRVLYDAASWARILAAADKGEGASIDATTRAQLLSDVEGLVSTERMEWTELVKSMQLLKGQNSSAVWMAGFNVARTLSSHLSNTDVFSSFKTIATDLTQSLFEQTGLNVKPTDDHNTRHLRTYVAPYACDGGNAACLAEAKSMVADLLDNGVALPVDMAATALCYGIRASDAAVFNKVKQELWPVSRADKDMRQKVTQALTCTADQSLVTGLLDGLVAEKSTMQSRNDTLEVLNQLITPIAGHRDLVVDYFRANLVKIDAFFGTEPDNGVTIFLSAYIDTIRSESEYNRVLHWASTNLSGRKDYGIIKSALEHADARLDRWYRKNYDKVSAYIYEVTGTTPPPSEDTTPGGLTTKATNAPGPGPNPPTPSSTPKPNGAAMASGPATSVLALVLMVAALAHRS